MTSKDTPTPIATPEETARRIVKDARERHRNLSWATMTELRNAIAAALASSNAEIERRNRALKAAEARLVRLGDVSSPALLMVRAALSPTEPEGKT